MVTKEQVVKKYLDKNYRVSNKRFFNSSNNEEWGFKIVNDIETIFTVLHTEAEEYLLKWAFTFGLSNKEFLAAIKPQKLKVKWSKEMIQDLKIAYGVETAEEQLVRQIGEEIAREIDSQIIKNLIEDVKTTQDLEDLAKCVGYESIPLRDDSFTLKNGFESIKSTEIEEHRKISKIWNLDKKVLPLPNENQNNI